MENQGNSVVAENTGQPHPRYIREVNGRNFIMYAGLLELAERKGGLSSLLVEVIQHPTESNGHTAVCKATATLENGKTCSDIGEASEATLDHRVKNFLHSMASTRAKARSLKTVLGIGLCCLEELNSFADIIPANEDKLQNSATHTDQTDSSQAVPDQAQQSSNNVQHLKDYSAGKAAASEAQKKAIFAIATRRRMSNLDLVNLCQKTCATDLDHLTKKQASHLIDVLKAA